jgi:CBS domain-containing protein
MKVRDIMTREVVAADPQTSVDLVARLMAGKGLSRIPVVEGRARGRHRHRIGPDRPQQPARPPAFFQVLDGRIPLETPGHYRKCLQHMLGTQLRDVMTTAVVTVGPEEDVETLAELMVARRVNPVPVVEDGRLVGIVSRADIVALMARDIEGEGQTEPQDSR